MILILILKHMPSLRHQWRRTFLRGCWSVAGAQYLCIDAYEGYVEILEFQNSGEQGYDAHIPTHMAKANYLVHLNTDLKACLYEYFRYLKYCFI